MATGLTPNYSLSYPLSTDPVNVAADIQELAEDLDAFLTTPAFIGNITVNAGGLNTSSATAAVFNTGATTLNIGGAATTTNIGNTSGQVNVRGNFNIADTKVYEINDVTVLSASALGSGIVSSSLATLGTITTGTWNASTIAVNRGGTGLTSYTIGDIIYASASATLSVLSGVATGNALISGGIGAAPSWGKIDLTTHVSGTLPVANGGTGLTALGAGIVTWLATPSSANLAAAVTDETGTGSLVFADSPALAGTPTSASAAVDTNTNQIATTAFVVGQAGSASPIMDGIATAGTSLRYARQDHIHPSDTSRAALSGATFTGTVVVPAASTSISPIRIPHGSAPSSPTNGDIWTTIDGLFARINGTTQQYATTVASLDDALVYSSIMFLGGM